MCIIYLSLKNQNKYKIDFLFLFIIVIIIITEIFHLNNKNWINRYSNK